MSGRVRGVFRQEFSAKNLRLRYEHYEYFLYSQCLPVWLLWAVRLAMGGFCLGVFTYMSIKSPFINLQNNSTGNSSGNSTNGNFNRYFYLCYLTIWSYLIITLYFLISIGNMVTLKCQLRRQYPLRGSGFTSTDNLLQSRDSVAHVGEEEMALGGCNQAMLRLQWLLYGVAANAAIIVTVGYFGVLYPMIRARNPGPVATVDVFVHALNSVFMLIEVLASGMPVRIVHAVFTAAYGTVYAIFSLLYWLPDHSRVIYPVMLDWNNPGLTLLVSAGILLVGLPVIQLFWWLVYQLRCAVAAKVAGSSAWSPSVGV